MNEGSCVTIWYDAPLDHVALTQDINVLDM